MNVLKNSMREYIIYPFQHLLNSFVHRKLNTLSEFSVRGHPLSPLKHLYLKESFLRENELLEQISNEVCFI